MKVSFRTNTKVLNAIRDMGLDQGLSDDAVINQALRLYQLVHIRLKDGETFSFSGDAQRARDFIGCDYGALLNLQRRALVSILKAAGNAKVGDVLDPNCHKGPFA
jgi:hypothetical protein